MTGASRCIRVQCQRWLPRLAQTSTPCQVRGVPPKEPEFRPEDASSGTGFWRGGYICETCDRQFLTTDDLRVFVVDREVSLRCSDSRCRGVISPATVPAKRETREPRRERHSGPAR